MHVKTYTRDNSKHEKMKLNIPSSLYCSEQNVVGMSLARIARHPIANIIATPATAPNKPY